MKNYVQKGDTVTLTAPYQRNSGQAALVGNILGIATGDVANGVAGEFMTTGVYDVDKVSAQAWTVGALIYWDDTAHLFTTVSTSNKRVGCALAVANNPSALGRVRLEGVAT